MPTVEIFPYDPPRHYSRAARYGSLVFLAGLCSRDPRQDYATVGATLEEQCHVIFGRIRDTLAEAGASLEHVVKVTIYLADIRMHSQLASILPKYFAMHPPPVTIVGARLVREHELIEIDVTAVIPTHDAAGAS